MNWFIVYLFTRVNIVGEFTGWVGFLGGLILLTIWAVKLYSKGQIVMYPNANNKEEEAAVEMCKEITKRTKWIIITCLFVTVLLPSQKEIAAIVILPKIVNSEIAQDLPGDFKEMYELAKDYIEALFSNENTTPSTNNTK